MVVLVAVVVRYTAVQAAVSAAAAVGSIDRSGLLKGAVTAVYARSPLLLLALAALVALNASSAPAPS